MSITSLLDRAESRSEALTTTPAQRLRTTMAAVRLSFTWFGVQKSLTAAQKAQAAEAFDAEGQFLRATKKLIDTNQADEAALAKRKKQAQRAMLAALCGVPQDEVADSYSVRYGSALPLPQEAAEALDKRQAAHQEQLLADDPTGREIAGLEAEKENLLNTVWLACSPAQIRALWSKVGVLLGDEPTHLEREALAIEPGGNGNDGPA